MELDGLMNFEPKIKVKDILRLFLLWEDDLFKLNLIEYYVEPWTYLDLLSNEKVNSSAWYPYYEDIVEEIFMSEDSDKRVPTLVIRRNK